MHATDGEQRFFAYARERYSILLRRVAGGPTPWTDDVILQRHRFTNIRREQDRTTVWFRKNVRGPIASTPEVLLATVVFRWFNRVTTGEALFCQRSLGGQTAFKQFLDHQDDTGYLKSAILAYCGRGPYVTGAFIINTPPGMSKLDGVLWAIGQFVGRGQWRHVASELLNQQGQMGFATLKTEGMPVVDHWGMEDTWNWLRSYPRMGDFMAYEVVCDLRYTPLLADAHDIMSWANPGPGARRGLSYIHGGNRRTVPDCVRSRAQQIQAMQHLLQVANHGSINGVPFWPREWPRWEMREVEHTLCEFAKYEMVRTGEGRTKGMFHGGG